MKTAVINRKRWGLRYLPMRRLDGECDPPEKTGKEIRVARRLLRYPVALTETLIHEALHAGLWPLSEEAVAQIAADITRLLDREGCIAPRRRL